MGFDRYSACEPPQHRVDKFQEFLAGLYEHMREFSGLRSHDPLRGLLLQSEPEMDQHDKGESSNYLISLCGRITNKLFQNRGFHLHKCGILLVAGDFCASMAEVLICAFVDSCYKSGHGFNIAGAGESNDSIRHNMTMLGRAAVVAWIKRWCPRRENLKSSCVSGET